MPRRTTGRLQPIEHAGRPAEAFVPLPLPPADPPLSITGDLAALHTTALAALDRLRIATNLVPDAGWFLYGFARKEAVSTSRIEGTQATLRDVLTYEATDNAADPDDVEEVFNYVRALAGAREDIDSGVPAIDLLKRAHATLMQGTRGADHNPGRIRTTQNWIAGSHPSNALFVPPPPDEVEPALEALKQWILRDDPLPPLVRIGLAHAQFVTIHPFDDGNGRIGRLLIALLLEQWGLCDPPLLYISAAFRRDQLRYYSALSRTRSHGDWEGWTSYFLRCVHVAADDAIDTAQRLARLVETDRKRLLASDDATVTALRLFEALPRHPIITSQLAESILGVSTPTTNKAIAALTTTGILGEQTGKRRDREYVYSEYLAALTGDDESR